MSGGKGGGSTTTVELPAWLDRAAQANLRRAEATSRMGYIPYYGPEVAGFSPMEQQAMMSTGSMAEAYGLAPSGYNPLAGIPQAQQFEGGLSGYASAPMLGDQIAAMAAYSPMQLSQYGSLPTTLPGLPDREGNLMPVTGAGAGALPPGTNPAIGPGYYTTPYGGYFTFNPYGSGYGNLGGALGSAGGQVGQGGTYQGSGTELK